MTTRTPPLGTETRKATISGSSVNAEARTAEIIWTTGARVKRSTWADGPFWEELSLDPKHVRMGRLASGRAPFLTDHNGSTVAAVIGVITSARLEAGRGVATVRFATDPDSDVVFQKIREGVLANVSVGYRVHRLVKVESGADAVPVFRAEDWEPFEVSVVPMGADPNSFVRSSTTNQESNMKNRKKLMQEDKGEGAGGGESPEVLKERERVAHINHACRTAKMEHGFADRLIADGVALDKARELVIEELAKRSEEIPTSNHIKVGNDLGDEGVNQRLRLQAEALAARAGGPECSPQARQYMNLRIVDHAKLCLDARGKSTRLLSDSQIITRAGTGDFPALLQATGDRVLLAAYASVAGGAKSLAREVFARDFRAMSRMRVSEAPELEELPEFAEIKTGRMSESKETYAVKTYAKIFGLTRKAMTNDDLGAFQLLQAYGRAAAEKENQLIVDLITSNPAMDDGFNLFSTEHANIGIAPAAITGTALGEGMKMLRLQKGLDGVTPINAIPDRLLVPASLESAALQYTRELAWNLASEVQPFKFQVIVDPRLDAASTKQYYMFSSNTPCLEIAHLDGANGPILDVEQSFDTDGTRFRARLDVGVGIVDFRGAYRNETP